MKYQPLTLVTLLLTSMPLVAAPKWSDQNAADAELATDQAQNSDDEESVQLIVPAKEPVRANKTRWKIEVKDSEEKNEIKTIENPDGTTTIRLEPEIINPDEAAPSVEAMTESDKPQFKYEPQPQMLRNGKPITLPPPTSVPEKKPTAVLQPLDESEASAAPSGIIRNGKSVELPTRGLREVKPEDTSFSAKESRPPSATTDEPSTPPPAIQRNGQEVVLNDAPIQRNGKPVQVVAPSLFKRNGKTVNLEPSVAPEEKPVIKREVAPSLFRKPRDKNAPKMVIEPIVPQRPPTDETETAALPPVNPLEANPLLPPIDGVAPSAGSAPATAPGDIDALAATLSSGGGGTSSTAQNLTPPAAGEKTGEAATQPSSFIVSGSEAYAVAVENGYCFMPRGCINRPDGRGSVAQILPGTNSSLVNGVTMRQMQTLPGWGNISRNTFYLFSNKRGGPKPLAEGWKVKAVEITGSNWNWVAKPQEGARSAYLAIQLTGQRGGNQDSVATVSRIQLLGPPGAKEWKDAFKAPKE